jgi:hypothetical protein
MNKRIIGRILLALAAYGIFVLLVMKFYDDSPANMKWEDREDFNRQFIAELKLESFTFEQALKQLGSPDITEAMKIAENYYQVMFYRTNLIKADGMTTQEECTALLFRNGLLTAIGNTAYESFKALQ